VPPVIESLTGLKMEQLLDRLRTGLTAPPPPAERPADRQVDGGVAAPPSGGTRASTPPKA
jgi:hypothetical protein